MGGRKVLTERGSVTVEFFLALPLVMVVLIAGLQVVSVVQTKVELQGAVREGVRVAATTPDPAAAVDAVASALAPEIADRVRISVSRPAAAGKPATVTATMQYVVDLWILPDISVGLSANATMRTEK